ncbi:MAG: Gfo/Idh/MocA family oxidoreductase [Verrucomicrobiota bacterium]
MNHPMMNTATNAWSRRQFLAAVGTVSAAPLIVPASVLGRDGTVAPSNRIVMGNFGVGNRARAILPHFMSNPEILMHVVCDCRADRLKSAKEMVDGFYKNTDCETQDDFRDLLARKDVDAVFIATGNRWHGMGSILAAKAGKDVYSEKPVSLTIAEGRALCDITKRLGIVYQGGHQRRNTDSYKFMAEVVRKGMIGKVHTVINQVWEGPVVKYAPPTPVPAGFNYDMWLGQTPYRPFNWGHVNTWQYFWDTAEGVITDMGCHYTDLMQMTLNMDHTGPVEYEGKAEFPDPREAYSETPIRGEVRCRYANGVTGVIAQRGKFADRYIRFIGSEGWIQVDDQTNLITAEPKSILSTRVINSKSWADTGDHIGDFVRAIKNRTLTSVHPEAAHRAISVCQLANICLRLGRKLKWDPEKELFTNDHDANRMLARAPRAPWRL